MTKRKGGPGKDRLNQTQPTLKFTKKQEESKELFGEAGFDRLPTVYRADKSLNPVDRCVLLEVWGFYPGVCWESARTMAENIGCGRKAVLAAIRKLTGKTGGRVYLHNNKRLDNVVELSVVEPRDLYSDHPEWFIKSRKELLARNAAPGAYTKKKLERLKVVADLVEATEFQYSVAADARSTQRELILMVEEDAQGFEYNDDIESSDPFDM